MWITNIDSCRTQQERTKKRMEFENQKNRITNQLEFERSRDTQSTSWCFKCNWRELYWVPVLVANVERWERAVNDDEEELERAKQAEQKQMSEIDQDMRKLENHKSERMAKKNELDNMDEEIARVIDYTCLHEYWSIDLTS